MSSRKKPEKNVLRPCLECGEPTLDGIIDFSAKPGEDILIRLCENCRAKYEIEHNKEGPGAFHKYTETLKAKRAVV